ncbi:hypothetical protein [Streptomyces sp. NBC_00094]|uniref:hypothetical protein n=1 Tax=Streptomyces sp. NBC_00094 TaxID=2903620 RepID=UPI002252FC56|nr:hypothetical protein [Streptomyces sp. NBC_00094]MCX5392428.1 hypothetical protein [Streptomyces sp. NBC_00094]
MPNSARSRERSGRSGRSLLLVPALLTALLGTLVPTGTALAATPAPTASTSTPVAQAPSEPAPEPSATTDPTPDPTPTVDPTPDPTETATPCPALPLTSLGDPGDAAGSATVEGRGTACFTVTVEKPGLHRMLYSNQHAYPSLYSGETPVVCENFAYRDSWCELAVGTYTLKLYNSDWSTQESGVSLVPLMPAPGCPGVPGTGYDTAPATGQGVGPLGVVCHAFTAAPGERITAELPRADQYWITDHSGKRICPPWNADGSVGCVLPEGSAGYRVLAVVKHASDGSAAPYTLTVRRLSNPVGCAAAHVNAYGTAPTEAAPQTGCRTFTPAATGRYDVRIGDMATEGVEVYAPDGTTACAYEKTCALDAGVPYTVVTDRAVRVLDLASPEGCVSGVPLAVTHRSTFGAPGSVGCLHLPVPQDAHVAVLTDRAADVTVVDANGTAFCEGDLTDGTCALGGTAPYRALVAKRDPYAEADGYGLVVHRTDAPSDCRTFLPGDFTTKPTRMSVRTGEGVFADCLTIPADGHSARELMQIQRVAGTSNATVSVLDANGRQACTVGTYNSWTTCNLTPGLAHTVLVQGDDVPAEFALTRRDVTATALGCVTTPATAVGGPSTAGVPATPGTFLCHQVTTADARDTLHLNARDVRSSARLGVYDANGDGLCGYFTKGCAVTGSTRYQALVVVREDETPAPAYRLDALRIGTASGPAPECVKVPNVSYGFGPLVGTLSEQKTAVCAVLPTAAGDMFALKLTPAGTFEQMPTPWLYRGSPLVNGCQGQFSSAGQSYSCRLPSDTERTPQPSTLVIGLPEAPAQATTAMKAEFTCERGLCGSEERTIGTVGPATVAKGKITMTVTGTALHEQDVVFLANTTASFRAWSTTVSVAPDRRSMQVSLDLTNAPLGPLNVTVSPYHGYGYPRGTVTVVAPLRNTAAPKITGTVVVGGKVTAGAGSWTPAAESYAYQWRANGVAIAGATASTYTIPSTLQGKQLSLAVTARKAGHPVVTATSGAAVVKGVAPKPTKVPYVSGSTRVGNKMTAVVGSWSPAPTSFTYQWRANGVAISGATSSTYVPVASTLGKKLTVTVTAHRTGHYSGAYTTAGYTVGTGYAPRATAAPYTTGTVRVGRTLSLNRGTWTPAPTSYAYQWYANGRAVSGATKSWLTLTSAQRGAKITVRVTAHRTGHYSGVAWTRATSAVLG